ncbi:MAG TPA: MFS transporter [Desulfomonilaceae bacterium]|nr:MFS transporter [Desulfomonilaceae bacterium]
MFAVGSLNFAVSMFYRSSTAVISPALVNDFGLTGAQLSDLSAVFFYSFAFSQIPIGMALDRLGPRITMSFLAVAAVTGALVFAKGQTPNQLILGRTLLGIGMAGNLMAVLTLLAVWFPVDRFAFLSGMVVSIGVLGSLFAATPLTLLSMSVGWRASFLICAGLNAFVVLSFILIMKDCPDSHCARTMQSGPVLGGLGRLFRMYSYWAISLANFVRYGFFAALQSLWAGPFLMYGLGMGEIAASNAILFMGLGYMAGLPLSGSLSDRVLRSRKNVVLASMIIFCVLTGSIIPWTSATHTWILFATFFGIGLTAAPGQILYAHMKELLPPTMIAQAMTAVNLFTTLGAGVMTHVLSLAIGCDPCNLAGPDGFRPLWYVGGFALMVVCLMYGVVPDSTALKTAKS